VRDTGHFTANRLPAIFNLDTVGTISALGSSVTKFSVGDRVVFQAGAFENAKAGLQEYALQEADYVVKIPDTIEMEACATLPANIPACFFTIFDETGFAAPYPWDNGPAAIEKRDALGSILIVGGGSETAKFATQFAKAASYKTIVTTASLSDPETEPLLKKFGATHVIDRKASNVLEQIKSIVGEDLLQAFDPINNPVAGKGDTHALAQQALSNTKSGGRVITLTPPEAKEKWVKKDVEYTTMIMGGVTERHPETAKILWDIVPEWLEKGILVPGQREIFGGLEDVNKCLDIFSRSETRKKRQLIKIAA
jgi:NADPH:quinone reductase